MPEIQEQLGKAIFDYFLQRTSPNEDFYLLVDSYTYEYCANQAGLTESDINKLLEGYGFYDCYKPLSSLAIAALEVKIAYDVETNSDLINSYNRRLIEKIKYCEDENSVQKLYQTCDQEAIWRRTKELFAEKNRTLLIPEAKTKKGRYVQFPLSQRIVSGRKIIEYADKFIELGLEQNSGITFDYFEKLVLKKSEDKMIKRMVFSFYCMWDGRSYNEIYNRTKISNAQREQQAKDEFCIRLEPEIAIYINQKKIDFEKDEIDYKYLWKLDENKYLTHKGIVFIQDENYNDWLPLARNKSIDINEDVLLISQQQNVPKHIEDFIKNGKAEIFEIGKYRLILLSCFSQEDFEELGIKVTQIPYFSLLGGLKIKRNTYYDFALPAIKLSDNFKDYKKIFVDLKEYPVENGIAKLTDKLSAGKHYVKLLNSWKSSEVYFYVENVQNTEIADIHGWDLNCAKQKAEPAQDSEKIIDGLKSCKELKWIFKDESKTDETLRTFQRQNDKLVNRFIKIGNMKLNRRSQYGN